MNNDERLVNDLLWLFNMILSTATCLVLVILAWWLNSWILLMFLIPAGGWCLLTWIKR